MHNRVPHSGAGRTPSPTRPASPSRPPVRPPVRRKASRKTKKRKARRDITLLIFEALGRIASLPKNAYKNFKRTKRYREISLVAFGVLVLIGGLIALNIVTRPNAFEVHVGGQNLGIVRWENRGELDPHYIEVHALTRLSSHLGTEIFPTNEIVVGAVRAGRNTETVSFDTMISAIEQALDFYVYAAIISVNGAPHAILPNADQAAALLDGIIESHANGSNGRYGFVQSITISTAQTHKNDLQTIAAAKDILTTPRQIRETYTVRSGDSLYTIAQRFGMSLSALLAANPNINPDALLQEGTPLLVTPNVPILSVLSLD